MKTLYTNGKIFTSNETHPYVDCMLVEDGKIIWTGAYEEMAGEMACACGSGFEIADLKGRTVIPGFVDAHMHPMMMAEYSRQIPCLYPRIDSIAKLTEEIAGAAAKTPEGGWIRGFGYDEEKYIEKRSPNRYDLDAGCSDKPVFLVRCCEHIRCVNSMALKIAGITKDTPDPPGGSIDRDGSGEPTGILRDNARDLVLPYIPKETDEEMVDALADLGMTLSSQGITAIADMGNLRPGGNYEYFAKAMKKGFRQRVTMYYMWDYFMDDPEFVITPQLMDHESRIRIAGIKLIGDGSISGKTAWLSKPYRNTDEYGAPVYSEESMEKAIGFAKRRGCQISIHAMGGRAVDRIMQRFKDEEDWTDAKSPCLRIEHVTEISDEALKTAAEKGFALVSQPIFEYSEIEAYKSSMDEERLKHIYPYRTELERGAKICLSTDAPANSWAVPTDPFTNLKAAVTRIAYDGTDTGQSERLDIETAVKLYTREAAKICGFAGSGELSPGCSADFIVLSDDIFTSDSDDIDKIQVEETYIEGEKVFSRC